ncbi:MAG TPA: rhodanese-like domain-containing protein [Aggregatilineales bacterium]|nr:DUF983 domain-containing protein [Chloroflexota bacterium]HOA25341.1 rhodanese-like domain-containing protein [Aggregatilineales bacterium]HPV07149.1 rhodanese-like domain-containing protein [Aggregatilineales bacterium]HQA68617.1 rhodanese-like domain-containing protein [Aggregatilineales bacterium]HQE18631.1 rhodanese-like domain-containing protein [Aggregatilineales bacterium]
MEQRRCPNCSAGVSADADHCPECGTALRQEAARPGPPVMLLFSAIMLLVVVAIAVFVFSRGVPVADSEEIPYPGVPRIPVEQAKELFDAGEVLFVDTRQETSYEQAHIPGAVHLPKDSPREAYAALPRDVPIITYCT